MEIVVREDLSLGAPDWERKWPPGERGSEYLNMVGRTWRSAAVEEAAYHSDASGGRQPAAQSGNMQDSAGPRCRRGCTDFGRCPSTLSVPPHVAPTLTTANTPNTLCRRVMAASPYCFLKFGLSLRLTTRTALSYKSTSHTPYTVYNNMH